MRFSGLFSRRISLWVLPLMGAIFLIVVNRPLGIGVAHDSLFYISMAKHIAAGKGVYAYTANVDTIAKPITRFCPFYPFVLSFFFFLGCGIKFSVATLNAVLLAANIYLMSLLVFRFTKSYPAACLTGLIFLLDPLWQSMHSYILTEPLFIFVVNMTLLFLWKYLETKKQKDFILAAVFCGIVSLTRYTGISYAISGALCLFLLMEAPFRERAAKAFWFGLFSSLPLLVWFARNIIKTYRPNVPWARLAVADLAEPEGGVPRTWWDYTLEACDKTMQWLSQYFSYSLRVEPVYILGLFLFGLGFAIFYYQKNISFLRKEPSHQLPYLLILHGAFYLFFLISYLCLAEQTMPIDQRYMMIFYMYLVGLLVIGVHWQLRSLRQVVANRTVRGFFYVLCAFAFILWLGLSVNRTRLWAKETRIHGADNTNGLAWLYVNSRHWFSYRK